MHFNYCTVATQELHTYTWAIMAIVALKVPVHVSVSITKTTKL